MRRGIPRRAFLAQAGSSAWGTAASLGAEVRQERAEAPSDSSKERRDGREVRLERLRPREIEQAMQACPVLYQPLGTVEWHGLHNIVGLDAVKAHHLCVRAARRGGGLVAPALFGGVGGRDPREATRADGEKLAETIIGRLARLASRMPQWDAVTRQRFVEAEAALVNRQLALAASEKAVWAGWRNLGKGVLSDYGRLLTDEKFEEIVELTRRL
jgi:hypothetical protein